MRINLKRRRQSGITLIEVLFAIGVVVIGLFGVVALIPLAGSQARIGIDNDRAHLAGRAAIQDFDVYGMRRQASWCYWNPVNSAYERYSPWNFGRESFCIDPRFMATHSSSLPTPIVLPPANANAQYFPAVNWQGTSAPPMPLTSLYDTRMRRITLYSMPGGTLPMTLAQADHIFMSGDDLSMTLPDDETLDPIQTFDLNNNRRQAKGTISWMATLTPKMNFSLNANVPDDQYILSIVVFGRRDPGMFMDKAHERVSRVKFHGDGYGGGEVTLYSAEKACVDVQEDDWVMLAAPSHLGKVFRWYRVLTADFEPVFDALGQGEWSRDVTLQGPDWDRREWHYPAPLPASDWPVIVSGTPGVNQPFVTQAVIMRGIIGVYEKTVRLETSSLWEQN